MKDYKNVAEDVFRRSGEVIEENKRRRKRLAGIGVSAACWAAAAAVGFGVWKTSGLHVTDTVLSEGQFAKDGKDHSGESDVVLVDPAKGGDDPVRGGIAAVNDPLNTERAQYGFDVLNGGADVEGASVITGGNGYFTTIIDRYDTEGNGRIAAPKNGQVIRQGAVIEAAETYGGIDENGKEIIYKVVVEYYKNGVLIAPTLELWESEYARIKDNISDGSGIETYSTDWGKTYWRRIHLCLTKEQLKNFTASEEYGNMIYMYRCYSNDDEVIQQNVYFNNEELFSERAD